MNLNRINILEPLSPQDLEAVLVATRYGLIYGSSYYFKNVKYRLTYTGINLRVFVKAGKGNRKEIIIKKEV